MFLSFCYSIQLLHFIQRCTNYDAMINNYLRSERKDTSWPETLTLTFEKVQEMRYGENGHQPAAFYKEIANLKGSLTGAKQLHGKELSYNNIINRMI